MTRPLTVVFPFCQRDLMAALKNLEWIAEMGKWPGHNAVLSYDPSMPHIARDRALQLAQKSFDKVNVCLYPLPPVLKWPVVATFAFQCTARYMMATQGTPYLWLEADAIPVRPDWLAVLQAEYDRAGKPFMGAIVPGLGHMNGVGIYPTDFPKRCPKTMGKHSGAWDTIMRPEMIHQCHNVPHLLQTVWGIVDGKIHHTWGDDTYFASQADLDRWLLPSAVTYHRCKNTSLIDQLRIKNQKST